MAYKTPKHIEEQKQKKKKQILDAAAKVFCEKGYHGTTVKDIVDEAEISVGSFYFYFKSKEEIFENLFDEMSDYFMNVGEAAVQGNLSLAKQAEIGITVFLQLIMENRHLAKILMIESVSINPRFEQKRVEKWEFFTQYIKGFFDIAIEEGTISPMDTKIAAYAYTGAIINVITHWLNYGEPENLLEAAPTLIKFNLGGLGIRID